MLVGWYKNAHTKYPGDNWRLATLENYQWLEKYVRHQEQNFPVQLATSAPFIIRYPIRNKKDTFNLSHASNKNLCFKKWDYAIMSPSFLTSKQREEIYPFPEVLRAVKVDGIPISAVSKRSTTAKRALQQYRSNNYREALRLYKKIYQNYPENYCTWFYLGKLYLRANQLDKAERFLKKYTDYFPDVLVAQASLADVYYKKQQYVKARQKYYLLLKNNVDFVENFKLNFLIANCFYQTNDHQKAIQFLKRSLKQNGEFTKAKKLLQKIKRKQG